MGHLGERWMLSSWSAKPSSAVTLLCTESSSFPEKSPEVKADRGFIGWSQHCDLHPETTDVTKLQEQIPKSAEPRAEAAE